MFPMSERTNPHPAAKPGDQSISFLSAGAGQTTVVLVHGWPQTSHEWRQVMPQLADRFAVVAPDLPGIGASGGLLDAAPVSAFEKAALARMLRSFVTTLSTTRLVLVGHDIGGMIAYAYARLFPEDLAGVVVLDVPLPGIPPWDELKISPQAWHFDFHAQDPLAEQLVTDREATYFRAFIDRVAKNQLAIPNEDVAIYAAAYRAPSALRAGFGLYRSFSADEAFNKTHTDPLGLPLLLASADGSFGAGVHRLAKGLNAVGARDVRTAVIANSGHWVAEEQPAAVVELIAAFASGLA